MLLFGLKEWFEINKLYPIFDIKMMYFIDFHHKFTISQNFNIILMKKFKQYVCAKFVGFKI